VKKGTHERRKKKNRSVLHWKEPQNSVSAIKQLSESRSEYEKSKKGIKKKKSQPPYEGRRGEEAVLLERERETVAKQERESAKRVRINRHRYRH